MRADARRRRHGVGTHLDARRCAVALAPRSSSGSPELRADRCDQSSSQVCDRAAVGVEHAVAGRRPGALGRAAATIWPMHRLERRPVQTQADALEHVAFDFVGGIAAQVERVRRRCGRARSSVSRRSACRCSARLQHSPAQVLPGRDRLAVDRAHRVAGVQAAPRRQALPAGGAPSTGRASGRPYMNRPA